MLPYEDETDITLDFGALITDACRMKADSIDQETQIVMTIQEMELGIKQLLSEHLAVLYNLENTSISFSLPPENVDAEYAMECYSIAKQVRKSPAVIAESIASSIAPVPDWIESITSTGPYLNIRLKKSMLETTVLMQATQEGHRFGWQRSSKPQRIIVEYSSPNTNKPLHLGHIRNNVLGVAVVNLLRAMGHEVIPASILNDRGIHICKAMVAYRHYFDGQTPQNTGLKGDHFVGMIYVRFDQESRLDEGLMDEAREMLRAWEAGDPDVRALWKTMNQWVIEGFEQSYERLGSHFDLVQYESQLYLHGKDIALDGLERGILFQKEDGSIWFDLRDIGLDEKAIVRGDGTSLYLTQDLGVAVERASEFHPDRVIYVVGSEQIYHFKVLFEVLKRLGYEWASRCVHLSYGMVYLPDGKMKSREGKVIDADNLMNDMKNLALEVMDESHLQVDNADREFIAEAIGVGAIKYYILKVGALKDIHFDPRASLSFDGATAAYLQYTYARIQSILARASGQRLIAWESGALGNDDELALLRKLMRFPQCLAESASDLNPSRLALYLLELAKLYNGFYSNHRVIDAPSLQLRESRLKLCESVAYAIRSGLEILGIKTVDRM